MLNLFGIALTSGAQSAATNSLVEGNTAFALELYACLSGTPGNVFFSPYSISTALAMTYAGARGETEAQMARVLHFNQDQNQVHSSFGELQRQWTSARTRKLVRLDIANALWIQKGEPFLPGFLKIAADEYQAGVNQADFTTDANAATREINDWVARKTMDKIQDILSPGSLDAATRLVLANAIYFKGAWANAFREAATSVQAFHVSTNSQVEAPLMLNFDYVNYTGSDDFQAVELPYIGNELSMVILLPRKIDGLGQLESQLSPAFLAHAFAQMQNQRVKIFLPKFRLGSDFKLNDTLAKMGMSDAFIWPKADFSGIDGRRQNLFISAVIHKSWIEVNEAGSEAAASTIVAVAAGAAPKPAPPPPVFRADHPFIFMIRDNRSGSLLFVGRLANPRA